MPDFPGAAIPAAVVDNLALLAAHILLVLAILRSLRADKEQEETRLKSWRRNDRA